MHVGQTSSVRHAPASIAGNVSSSFLEGQSFSGGSWPPVYMDVPNDGYRARPSPFEGARGQTRKDSATRRDCATGHNLKHVLILLSCHSGLHHDKLMAPPPIPLPPLPSAPQPFKSHVPKLEIAKNASNPEVELLCDLERGGDGGAGGVRLESGMVQKILSILRSTGNGLSSEIEAALLSDRSQPARKGDGEKLNAGYKNDLWARSTSNISNSLSSDEKAGVCAPPSPSQKSADGLGGQGSSLQGDYDIIWGVGSQQGTAQGSVEDDKPRSSLQKKISFSSFESVIESQNSSPPTKTESQNSSPPTKEQKEAAFAGSLSATSPPAVAPSPRLQTEATSSVEPAEAESTEGIGVSQRAKEEPWTSWVRNKSRYTQQQA